MNNLVWIALETLGDNATTCEVFEVAVVVTSPQLEPLNQFQSAVMTAHDRPLAIQIRVDGATRERFNANGLWEEMAVSSVTPLSVDNNLTRLLDPSAADGPLTVIASEWDRRVITAQYPATNALLTPGAWDVDSFVGLSRTFVPRARVALQPQHDRVAYQLNSGMQNLAIVVNALRSTKGTPTK